MSKRYKFEAVISIHEGKRLSRGMLDSLIRGFSPNDRFKISAKASGGYIHVRVSAADAAMFHSVMNTLISTIKTLEKIDTYE
ncbi:MAG: hypothetical protein QW292_01185 [Candidatus Parvarchaeota archaeon]